jgi:hypothetical protein
MKEPPKAIRFDTAEFNDEIYVDGFVAGVVTAYESLRDTASLEATFAAKGERVFTEEELKHLDAVINSVGFMLIERVNGEIAKRLNAGTYRTKR